MSVLATIDRYVYLNTNFFCSDTVDVVHKGAYIALGSATFIKTLTDGKSYSFMAPLIMIMTVCITTILQECMQKLH